MKKKWKLTATALLAVGVAGAAAALSMAFEQEKARIDALQPEGSGPLDGLSFKGMLGPDGEPKDIPDVFVFKNGSFTSEECELRCDYPARPYLTAQTEEGWRFTSTTRCPYKDATIVWHGTVKDNKISGVASWTLRRWYWSIERDFAFEGNLQSQPLKSAGIE